MGVYAIMDDSTCNFLCAGFDDKNCEHDYQEVGKSLFLQPKDEMI